MTVKKFFITALVLITSFLIISGNASARDWDDLHEEDEKIFGSEKEMKYNPDMFFLQRESWENHYSFMLFWLFKYTDYPKYNSLLFLPFYYGLDSKIDNRSLSFIPITMTYWETDGDEKFKINPLFVAGSSRSEGIEDNYSYSLLHGYTYYKNSGMALPDKSIWFPIIPLIYRSSDNWGGHMNIVWLLDYSWRRDKNGDESIDRFWFIPFMFHEPGDNGYTHVLPPFYLHNRHSNGEYWLSLIPLFKRSKDINYTYSGGKPVSEYEDSFKSLAYCYNDVYTDKWAGEKKSSEFWFPLVPLFYSYSEPGVESHRNLLWLIDWHNNAEGKLDRFWFIPLAFHEPGESGFTFIVPPIYIHNRHSNGEYWLSLFPLFKRSKDINYPYVKGKPEKEYEDSFKSLIYCYNDVYTDKWEGEKKTSEFWFPLVPLFYSYTETGVESHRNLLWLIDWHNNAEGKLDRFWFIPLAFHEPGESGFTFIVPPIYIHNRHSNGEFWLSLFPLFKRSKDTHYSYAKSKPEWEYEDSFKSLIYCYNDVYTDKWTGEKKSSEFWFPLVPLFYSYNEPGVESHRNLLWLIDWHNNAEGKTDRFWFAPFYFSGNDTYRHILPPLYISLFYSEHENYSHLLPVFLKYRTESTVADPDTKKSITTKNRLLLTIPYAKYSQEGTEEGGRSFNSEKLWFPIVPLYYHSEWSEGSHTNLLWAADWGRDKEGNLERFWFLPFVYHKTGEGGYRFYLPFYFRPSGWTEEKGVTYSPFYYHRWSPEEETKWSWLIHYKYSSNETGEYLNTWVPFYYNHEEPEKGKTKWIAPIYFHHDSLEHKGFMARVFAPLYWNFETAKRDTTLFLPLYFETKDKNGDNSLYINIIGISRSITSGVNPVIDAGLGFNRRGLYIDADVSWLYDMASFSTRMTVPLNKEKEPAEDEIAADTDSGKVTLSKKNGVSRDTSINFWGWHLLYGLVAYENADSKKHFRLLPLSWITWDDQSENKLKWILNYLSYKEDETEYFVFLPFYGYQRIGESYSKGYMLNGFWHEYDHEKQMNEYTVLWPIINWYSSPEKNGWRVAPIFWHKNSIKDGVKYSSTYTPLYLNRSRITAEDNTTLYRLNFSPLHFYRYNKENDKTSTLWFSSIPVLFYKNNETISRYTTPEPQTDSITNGKKTKQENPEVYHDYTTSDTLHWLLPFYYISETDTIDKGKNITTSDYKLLGLPLLYYHSFTEKNSDPSVEEKKKGTLFVMGYYSEFSSENNSASILFGLYESDKYPATGGYSYSLLYGLFNVSDMNGNYENYFRPFYYYGNDNGKKEYSALMGLYREKKNLNNGDTGFSLLYGLFSTSLYHYIVDPKGSSIPLETRETWLIPAFYANNTESTDESKPWKDNISFSPFHYRHNIDTAQEKSYTFWAPIIPLYYTSRESDSTFTNIGWLYNYSRSRYIIDPGKRDITVSEKETLFVPFFYNSNIKSADKEKPFKEKLSFSLLHYRHTLKDDSNNEYTFWSPIIPLFYKSSDSESTHTNICWLIDYEKYRDDMHARFWVMPFVYSKTGDDGYFHIAPLYFSFWDRKADDRTDIIFGLYLHNMPDYNRQNFLYLYDHKRYISANEDEYYFMFHTVKYEIDPEIKRLKAFWGLMADAEWSKSGYDIEGLLYLAAIEKEGRYFHSRILPFWYYERTEDTHTLVIPPALTWDSRDSDKSRFQLWALGALWFRNYEPEEKSDLQAALLGIPYYKLQRAERGYESRGSLWGLLWEYETESETGFSKFSLFKFIYKRVEMEGDVQHRVMGITF